MTVLKQNKVPPIFLSEAISKITVTPDAPNNLLSDWASRHNVTPDVVVVTKKRMKSHPTKKQLQRAKQYHRRTQ